MNQPLTIAERVAEILRGGISGDEMAGSIEVLELNEDVTPSYGISVSPESFSFGMGTADRDDVIYSILIVRVIHALGNIDHEKRLDLWEKCRFLFHNKRIEITDACHAFCNLDPTKSAIPEAWRKNNNSVIAVRVNVLVRESREEE